MPIYEYVCKKCKAQFELLIRANQKPQCPECKSKQLDKQFSVVATHSSSADGCPAADMGCPGAGSSGCAPGGCGHPGLM